MTAPHLDPKDIATAGEYVLGTLPQDERRAFALRLVKEPDLAAEVALWEQRLDPILDEVAAEAPPALVWRKVERRLFPVPATGNGGFWRSIAIGSSLLAAGLALFLVLSPIQTRPDAELWVADMVSADGAVRLAALYDETSGEMRVSMGGEAPSEGRDFELWLIQGNATISLGLMPRHGQAAMPIPEDLRALVANATLAITDEPLGGSGGVATGPVVAAAGLRRI